MENAEIHKEILNLPEYAFPAVMLVLGYPTRQQVLREKPQRVDMKHIVHENAYRPINADEKKEMWQYKTGVMSYEEWMKNFCNRKYNSDFSKEMSRSVQVYLDAFQK